jgi:NOL1/NOP2/sun family putative RNA methylase
MAYPDQWLENMKRLLGAQYDQFLEAMAQPPALALRLNALRQGAASPRAGDPVPWSPHGFYLRPDDAQKAGCDIAHAAGAYYMQEASAQAPVQVLAPKPGEVVMDLCAAPGGKSTQIAALLGGRGALVSNDIDFSRARALSGNIERMGVTNAAVVCAAPQMLCGKWAGAFDAILVDAPCSGEGMFRRDPDARRAWTPGAPAGCAARQAKILSCAGRMLRPGGRMVYSTCTFSAEENENVVEGFLRENRDFELRDFELPGAGRSKNGMLRLWPHRLRGDGHFVALLFRSGEGRLPQKKSAGGIPDALGALLPGRWAERFEGFSVAEANGVFSALPGALPELSGLRVLRGGLRLCDVRGHVKPDHALAMAFSPQDFDRAVTLDEAKARRYLAGEALRLDAPSGWTHVSWRGLPLGFGKVSEGALKNHLPKGLRIRQAGI